MGSKLSRAVRPQVKAAALPVATAQHHDIDRANAQKARQELTPQLPDLFSYDDISVVVSSTTPAIPQRRNSAPALSSTSAASAAMADLGDISAQLDLAGVQRRLTSIEYAGTDPDAAPAVAMAPPPPVPASPAPSIEPQVMCVICCTKLPDSKDPMYAKEVVKPCRDCGSAYCGSCIKRMFTECCKDTTRMPPRCCVQIQHHYAKPHLTKDEFAEFRAKYEEWLTPNPFYCPVPTCSTFIPERLLPEEVTRRKGKRPDSGTGTPTLKAIACPTCEAAICPDCRDVAHPNALCSISEFGIDAETTELLKSWGYKKCPKCGHGLKRMFGCSHMECRCGAHFCYSCMADYMNCYGRCEGADDYGDDYDEDEDDDGSPEGPNETRPLPTTNDTPALSDEATQLQEPTGQAVNATSQPASEPRNLDAGGHRYWERQDLYFGDEPTEDYQDRSWDCEHEFEPYTITLAKALDSGPSTELECVKCWCAIHAEISTPNAASNTDTDVKTVPAGARGANRGILRGTATGRGRGWARGRGRGRGRGGYAPPRGLFQADGAIGTAPHLRHTLPSPLSQSVPARESSPMEDVQYSSERVVDTYGNTIVTSELAVRRRASDDAFLSKLVPAREDTGSTLRDFNKTLSTIFSEPKAKFSLAYECRSCALLVCASCRDGILGV